MEKKAYMQPQIKVYPIRTSTIIATSGEPGPLGISNTTTTVQEVNIENAANSLWDTEW